ncbi:transmembrane protein 220-like [Dermacentor variabilis]|uniref:transmembrane protein 220-like n=1 Tax=Dermacentor variabilis TaxID=34621 RepID=UPI003F5C84D9
MAVFFAMASYVQLNDPDAILWIVAYALPCFASVGEALQASWWSRKRRIILTSAATMLSGSLLVVSVWFWLRDATCVGFNPVVCEYGRESGGSAIALIWMLLLRRDSELVGWKRATISATLSLLPVAIWTALLMGDGIAYLCNRATT